MNAALQDPPEDDVEDLAALEESERRADARELEVRRKRARIRLVQVAAYALGAAGIPFYAWNYTGQKGHLEALTMLFSIYLAIRGLAVFVKYRQDVKGPRYSQAYVEARDLFTQEPNTKDGPGAQSNTTPGGKTDG